jgi:hypothetical protein
MAIYIDISGSFYMAIIAQEIAARLNMPNNDDEGAELGVSVSSTMTVGELVGEGLGNSPVGHTASSFEYVEDKLKLHTPPVTCCYE